MNQKQEIRAEGPYVWVSGGDSRANTQVYRRGLGRRAEGFNKVTGHFCGNRLRG